MLQTVWYVALSLPAEAVKCGSPLLFVSCCDVGGLAACDCLHVGAVSTAD